jgi:hypothetical protein
MEWERGATEREGYGMGEGREGWRVGMMQMQIDADNSPPENWPILSPYHHQTLAQ